MSKGTNYRNLAAEFVIVFIGVAVALAADSWREDLSDRGLEREYLTRIESELEIGKSQLESLMNSFSTAFNSSDVLISHLEDISEFSNEALLVEHFTKATRTGGPGGGIAHSAVYSELISTGRLNLISNPDLRDALSNYYRYLDILSLEQGSLPLTVWERYRELTGNEAAYYVRRGIFPEGETADRLIEELSSGKLSIRHFRLLRTRLGLLTSILEDQLTNNLRLQELVKSEIG